MCFVYHASPEDDAIELCAEAGIPIPDTYEEQIAALREYYKPTGQTLVYTLPGKFHSHSLATTTTCITFWIGSNFVPIDMALQGEHLANVQAKLLCGS